MIKNRKYIGVPTQQEIINQYNEIVEMTKNITTLNQIKELKENNADIEIEINGEELIDYKNESIECIRYEYKNLLVCVEIDNDKAIHSDYVTLYSDGGEKFDDCLYSNYSSEIERIAKMGLLIENEYTSKFTIYAKDLSSKELKSLMEDIGKDCNTFDYPMEDVVKIIFEKVNDDLKYRISEVGIKIELHGNKYIGLDDLRGYVLMEDNYCTKCGQILRFTEVWDYNNCKCEYCQD